MKEQSLTDGPPVLVLDGREEVEAEDEAEAEEDADGGEDGTHEEHLEDAGKRLKPCIMYKLSWVQIQLRSGIFSYLRRETSSPIFSASQSFKIFDFLN